MVLDTGKIYIDAVIVEKKKAITANGLRLGVCYFALQTLQALREFNRQNNSTKPLLYAGGGWLNEN